MRREQNQLVIQKRELDSLSQSMMQIEKDADKKKRRFNPVRFVGRRINKMKERRRERKEFEVAGEVMMAKEVFDDYQD